MTSVAPAETTVTFRISIIIRLTLKLLFIALTLPLPFLARATAAPVPPALLWVGMAIGFGALWGALSERVFIDAEGIRVGYPAWVPGWFRSGWSLAWAEVADLRLRTTGQGGVVYYFVTQAGDRAYLLPMRVAGFSRLLEQVERYTAIDTRNVRPLAQPWMYGILFVISTLLLAIDLWTINTAANFAGFPVS
ncbi:MAG: hypothetical protein AAFY11_01375 [Cyanobacteria bacterium J06641_5]